MNEKFSLKMGVRFAVSLDMGENFLDKLYQRDTTRSIVVIWLKILEAENTIEIRLVSPTKVCGKVLSEKNG